MNRQGTLFRLLVLAAGCLAIAGARAQAVTAPDVLVNCVALAILLRIDWESRQAAKGLAA